MDFFYFKSKNIIEKSFISKEIFENEVTVAVNDYQFVKYDQGNKSYFDTSSNVFFSGKIIYDGKNLLESKQKFVQDIQAYCWPLPNTVSGYFSGFYYSNDRVFLFTDPVGIYNLFYYQDDETLVISTNLTSIYESIQVKLNYAGLVLETVNHYSQFARMTVLEKVYRLLPGELIEINGFEITRRIFDLSIKNEDIKPSKSFASDLVELINNESFKLCDNLILLSLSGGIDSRINLAPLIENNKKLESVNYGIKDLIDSSIAVDMAKKNGFNIEIIDPTPNLFPTYDVVKNIIKKTDSLYINMWHSILLKENIDTSKTLLLGDILDILRAKRISSLKSREFRTSFYIKKFLFGKTLNLIEISSDNKQQFKQKKIDSVVNNVKGNFKYFSFDEETKNGILKDVVQDVNCLFEHLDKYNCKYVESYEELYGLFTEGRLSMGKQLNILKYKFEAEIPLANIKILRKVLNISPNYRYADELTHKMFKHKSWRKLGKFPTAQNPFVNYTSSLPVMLFGWFLRSKIDLILTKINILTNGKFKKNRLFKTFNHQETYSYPNAFENYKSYLVKSNFCDFQDKINLFEKRMNKTSWPLASMDLMPFVQAMYYVNNFRKKG